MTFSHPGAFALLMLVLLCMVGGRPCFGEFPPPVPEPKGMEWTEGQTTLESVRIEAAPALESRERAALAEMLAKAGVAVGDEGTVIALQLGEVEIPDSDSRHHEGIRDQAHRIEIGSDQITITGNSPRAVFQALQTFEQLLAHPHLRHGTITDWPDLDLRMIMIDPARQNENMDYYRRVVRFAARYKINGILCHLTDDQTSALYHEDYPELMHAHAWTPEQVADLVAYAREHHIELIPEIESLGHSRMFERRENFRDYLHQTISDTPDESWMGTDLPGYTNVLCPASEHAVAYLDKMYARSAETFSHPWIHIGFDEVDMTHCARCVAAYGEQSPEEWMATALNQAAELVAGHGRKTAVWGDMLLQYPDVARAIPPEDTIIFDWYYRPDVTAESALFFRDLGFEVVVNPALACAPHMILPNTRNYENIASFTRIAREHDLLGVNTTIWVPVRYMSDVMWTGIAYAAAHAWGGSHIDEAAFFDGFTRDYFKSDMGAEYHDAWTRLNDILWHRPDIYRAAWIDEESLEAAQEVALERGDEVREYIRDLREIRNDLATIGDSVGAHWTEWRATEDSVEILQFTMEHLLAAPDVDGDGPTVRVLEAKTRRLLQIIENDWDRNRFAEDPGKDGRFLANQHLLHRFRQMHEYHLELMGEGGE